MLLVIRTSFRALQRHVCRKCISYPSHTVPESWPFPIHVAPQPLTYRSCCRLSRQTDRVVPLILRAGRPLVAVHGSARERRAENVDARGKTVVAAMSDDRIKNRPTYRYIECSRNLPAYCAYVCVCVIASRIGSPSGKRLQI